MSQNHKIKISNFRSFGNNTLFNLNKLNLFVGANNTGKSNLSNFFKMLKTLRNDNSSINCKDYFNVNEKNEISIELPIDEFKNASITGLWKFKPLEYQLVSQRNKVELSNNYFKLSINNKPIFIAHEKGDIYKQSDAYFEFYPENFIEYLKFIKQYVTPQDYLHSHEIELLIVETDALIEILNTNSAPIKSKNIILGNNRILDEVYWNIISREIKSKTIENENYQINEETSFLYHFALSSIPKCSEYLNYLSQQIVNLDFNSTNLDIPFDEYSQISFDLIKTQITNRLKDISDIKINNSNKPKFEIEDILFLKNNKWHTLSEFGSGFRRYLIFLMNLIIQIENAVPLYVNGCKLLEFVFIEEPENFLHPDLQIDFIELILTLLNKKNPRFQRVIIETHSPIIIRTVQHLTLKNSIPNNHVSIFDFAQNSIGNTIINQIDIEKNGLLSSPLMTGFDTKLSQIEFELWELRNQQNSQN